MWTWRPVLERLLCPETWNCVWPARKQRGSSLRIVLRFFLIIIVSDFFVLPHISLRSINLSLVIFTRKSENQGVLRLEVCEKVWTRALKSFVIWFIRQISHWPWSYSPLVATVYRLLALNLPYFPVWSWKAVVTIPCICTRRRGLRATYGEAK